MNAGKSGGEHASRSIDKGQANEQDSIALIHFGEAVAATRSVLAGDDILERCLYPCL